jgi:hypothetical protein
MRTALFEMFARLAAPPSPGTGAWWIRTEDGRDGVVLMEEGRVCWAHHDLGGRLSDEIERRHGVSRAAIHDAIQVCRATHQPFLALLVEQGHLTWPQLTSVLGEHTCRSILAFVGSGVRECTWVPHQGAGYAPETTISVTQTACRCIALVKGLEAEGLETSLETMLAGESTGMLIHIDSGLPFAASATPVTWPELHRWLTWTLRVDDLCRLPSRGYVTGRGRGGGWVMWRAGSMVGLAVSASENAQRRLLVRVTSALADWAVEQPT